MKKTFALFVMAAAYLVATAQANNMNSQSEGEESKVQAVENVAGTGNVYRDPQIAYMDGNRFCIYDNNKFYIMATGPFKGKKEFGIRFLIRYKAGQPVDFNPDESKAYMTLESGITELKAYSAEEYLNKLNKRILWFGPSNMESASSTVTNVTDGLGNKVGTVQSETQVYTGAADEAYAEAERSVREDYLKRNTLFEGREVEGRIAVAKPKKGKGNVEFLLKVDGDTYIFNFEI